MEPVKEMFNRLLIYSLGDSGVGQFANNCSSEDRPVVILLTACIDPGNTIETLRSNISVRMSDYQQALKKWVRNKDDTSLVFCENSGYDLSELKTLVDENNIHNKKIEFLSFYGQDFPGHLGKGYGEMGIIDYALKHSSLISSRTLLVKVTGRLFVPNIRKIIDGIRQRNNIEIFCNFKRNLAFSDSRVFCASIHFLKNYLIPMKARINDSEGKYFEHMLANATHMAIVDGYQWNMLPSMPELQGVDGTSNVLLPGSLTYILTRKLLYFVKAALLALK